MPVWTSIESRCAGGDCCLWSRNPRASLGSQEQLGAGAGRSPLRRGCAIDEVRRLDVVLQADGAQLEQVPEALITVSNFELDRDPSVPGPVQNENLSRRSRDSTRWRSRDSTRWRARVSRSLSVPGRRSRRVECAPRDEERPRDRAPRCRSRQRPPRTAAETSASPVRLFVVTSSGYSTAGRPHQIARPFCPKLSRSAPRSGPWRGNARSSRWLLHTRGSVRVGADDGGMTQRFVWFDRERVLLMPRG